MRRWRPGLRGAAPRCLSFTHKRGTWGEIGGNDKVAPAMPLPREERFDFLAHIGVTFKMTFYDAQVHLCAGTALHASPVFTPEPRPELGKPLSRQFLSLLLSLEAELREENVGAASAVSPE